ncbi:MAG: COX15/CtaA family protein [Limnohabitans sp.]
MNEVALFNIAPLLQLLLLALLLAAAPLSWVWLKNRQSQTTLRVRHLTIVVLFLTFDLVLFGAFTRLSDSGLGCPDWPGCYGYASPIGASAHIAQAQSAMPTGPVTFHKAWIEMIHRYLAMLVGVLILTLAAFSWRADRSLWGWPSLSLLWVCVQGAFGALTVTMKLFPLFVTLHLLGGMLLLVLLTIQLVRQRHSYEKTAAQPLPFKVYLLTVLTVLSVFIQTGLGAWVSSNYAVLACDTYPLCQNSWWPDMNLSKAFELWRPLGQDASGQALPFQALTAIHMVHRWHAVVPALLILWVARSWMTMGLRRQGWLLIGVLFLQFVTGISNAVLGWPMLAALMHTGSAAVLLVLLTWVLASTQPRKAERIAATFDRNML